VEDFRQVELSIAKRNIQATVTLWNDREDAKEFDENNVDFVRGVNIELSDLRSYVAYFAKAVFNIAGTPRWDDNQLILVKDISDDTILAAIATILKACEEDLAFDTETEEDRDDEEGEDGEEDDWEFNMPVPPTREETDNTIFIRLRTALALIWLTTPDEQRSHENLRQEIIKRVDSIIDWGKTTFLKPDENC
jgi:hypothetical protein